MACVKFRGEGRKMADMTCKLIEKLLEMSGFFRWSTTRQSEQYFSLERANQTVLEGHASGIFSIKSFIPSIVVHFSFYYLLIFFNAHFVSFQYQFD